MALPGYTLPNDSSIQLQALAEFDPDIIREIGAERREFVSRARTALVRPEMFPQR